MLELIAGGSAALEIAHEVSAKGDGAFPLASAALLCPIERPGKYLAIGMNYRKHIEEAERLGLAAPTNQVWFNKQTSCLSGPFDDIVAGVTNSLDYEVELAVIIGRPAKAVLEDEALDYVFGYTVANDLSARDWQRHSTTFTIAKSFDTYGPIGPCIVTADEISDPHALDVRTFVNGELRQSASTSDLLYSIWQQIAYLSAGVTLEPGDILATGTPSGVGVGMSPPQFLKTGDEVRCEIDQIGTIINRVR
ncbi:2-keto-4-pentenoate hydratase/2-oxohepta-3-ene-1,7-dioic acid hydratase in catechol pathway [Sphingobium xenophagum]|uniref:2-keto-4-pentenoate hydratase/2-oxohepta-3-ene-1,7-dioic acid hydratase in catechol pathway n=1 Tax=Sphingobium xenophagum TaxID=121428 RepID=A0ABU1X2C3_SPHXE|nr:fumarylacetoacetate hydrolase family protein [Sphingobium xenophagum]MDR7155711.1 2-keto-4-pentenoate hydratase/2-oxohepta-3-ene-1,7-dioic acid hydratase in catechol pathway [Sphingobium xenophagum]